MVKKAELTTTHIVVLSILILSFIILLFFYWQFAWKTTTDREICRQSVTTRGSLPAGTEVSNLNCKTQQVCISIGGECVKNPNAEIIKVKDKKEIIEELTNLMHDCWWQMGEGKINYEPKGILGKNYCAICSVVYFDDKIQQDIEEFYYLEIYYYMSKTEVPGKKQTYLQYFYNFDSLAETEKIFNENGKSITDYKFKTEKPYAIVTSISKKGAWLDSLIGIGAGVAGAFLLPFSGGTSTILIVAGGGFGYATANEGATYFIMPVEYDSNEIINTFQCKDFSTLY